MSNAVKTVEGWHSQHMIFKMDVTAYQQWTMDEKLVAQEELKGYLADLEVVHAAHEGSYGFYSINGHKGDLMLWILALTMEDLFQWEMRFRRLKIAAVLEQTYSYVSVTELSSYLQQKMDSPEVDKKLYPTVPRDKYVCFYNMSKQRNLEDNWFMQPMEERARMMKAHGALGRPYLKVLSEFTTGGTGLDQWEWGITLTGNDDVQFKKIVYEMRFEEASARFGIFSDFYVGTMVDDTIWNILFN